MFGGDRYVPGDNFEGSMSCVQVYNAALQPPQIHARMNCTTVDKADQRTPCPLGYTYFDSMCYKVRKEKKESMLRA